MDTAMDGIVGGVLGGAVTGSAVWLTLRHERRLRDDGSREAAVMALKTHLAAMLGLTSKAWTFQLPRDQDRIIEFIPKLVLQGLLGRARAASVAPRLAAVFVGFNDRLADALPSDAAALERFAALRQVLEVHMHAWMNDPDGYEERGPDAEWPFDPEDDGEGGLLDVENHDDAIG